MNNITPLPLALPPPRLTLFHHVCELLPSSWHAYDDNSTIVPHEKFTAAMAAVRNAEAYADEMHAQHDSNGYDYLTSEERDHLFGSDWRKWISEPRHQIEHSYEAIAKRAVEYMEAVASRRSYAAKRGAIKRGIRAAVRAETRGMSVPAAARRWQERVYA